jgi:hypothetical protein
MNWRFSIFEKYVFVNLFDDKSLHTRAISDTLKHIFETFLASPASIGPVMSDSNSAKLS